MTGPGANVDGELRDARLTAGRREAKYLLASAQSGRFAAALDARLARHRYRGEGANHLPGAHHYVTTIYFDTPSRALFRTCGDAAHLKLRAKEYYDLHPQLVETATRPRDLLHHREVLWLEIKHKDGQHTGKRRIGLPKRDVPAFFAEGRITPEMIAVQAAAQGGGGEADRARDALEAVAALCGRYGEPFGVDCLVNYRRLAWQDAEDTLRVTLDVGLAFFAPPADLWTHDRVLVREGLGPRVGHEPRAVIEVKTHDDPPAWLATLLAELGAEGLAYSKFEEGSRARHG